MESSAAQAKAVNRQHTRVTGADARARLGSMARIPCYRRDQVMAEIVNLRTTRKRAKRLQQDLTAAANRLAGSH